MLYDFGQKISEVVFHLGKEIIKVSRLICRWSAEHAKQPRVHIPFDSTGCSGITDYDNQPSFLLSYNFVIVCIRKIVLGGQQISGVIAIQFDQMQIGEIIKTVEIVAVILCCKRLFNPIYHYRAYVV